MTTIQQVLRSASVNGVINIDKALKALAPFDAEREETITILKSCERNVGMVLGEDINAHVAKMTGGYFNATEYLFERMPGEQ
ncbi:hypothetical protein A0256_23200 [Mucilaginibacter sp. PAMC 26640]|nr:hypothetical protein A0256_23200 [Mucilaginibacter sp. PAMC 26640]